jgi:hypothetical protein
MRKRAPHLSRESRVTRTLGNTLLSRNWLRHPQLVAAISPALWPARILVATNPLFFYGFPGWHGRCFETYGLAASRPLEHLNQTSGVQT